MGAQQNYLHVVPKWQNNISKSVMNSSLDMANAFAEIWDIKSMLKQERVYVIYFDADRKVIRHELLKIGMISQSMVDQRMAVEYAFECGASYIAIAHNHPSGNSTPSRPDFALTKEFQDTLRRLDMCLVDHIILTPTNYYSFQDHGYLK